MNKFQKALELAKKSGASKTGFDIFEPDIYDGKITAIEANETPKKGIPMLKVHINFTYKDKKAQVADIYLLDGLNTFHVKKLNALLQDLQVSHDDLPESPGEILLLDIDVEFGIEYKFDKESDPDEKREPTGNYVQDIEVKKINPRPEQPKKHSVWDDDEEQLPTPESKPEPKSEPKKSQPEPVKPAPELDEADQEMMDLLKEIDQ